MNKKQLIQFFAKFKDVLSFSSENDSMVIFKDNSSYDKESPLYSKECELEVFMARLPRNQNGIWTWFYCGNDGLCISKSEKFSFQD